MRRDQSQAGSDYRRSDNEAQWDTPLRDVPSVGYMAARNLERRLIQAARIYVEEAGIGE